MSIKHKIREWLFPNYMIELDRKLVAVDEQLIEIKEERERMRRVMGDAFENKSDLRYALDLVQQCINVGVDVHMKSESWAVVCLKGVPDYVKIMPLDSKSAFEIKKFLKSFPEARVDSSQAYYRFLKE